MAEYVNLQLSGILHRPAEKYSTATIVSEAVVSKDHRVVYEIKWDNAQVAPVNPHLDTTLLNQYQLDRSPDGELPTDPATAFGAPYFTDNPDGTTRTFYYPDQVNQRLLQGLGKWWFRLRIVDGMGNDLPGLSQEVEVDWSQGIVE